MRSAQEIVPLIRQLTKPDRVLDIACGTGEWLKVFRDHGARKVLGVDAHWIEPETLSIAEDEFLVRDIAGPLDIDDEFDLVLMLEAIQSRSRSPGPGNGADTYPAGPVCSVVRAYSSPGRFGRGC